MSSNDRRTRRASEQAPAPVIDPHVVDAWRASPLGATIEHLEHVVVREALGALDGCLVLDVGTGDGAYARLAGARAAHVVAIDPSRAMLDVARSRRDGQTATTSVARAALPHLPFADATFDVVIAVTVLCFVDDAARAVSELARVVAPGGRVLLADLSPYSTFALKRRVKALFGSSLWRRARFRSRAALVELARDAGLVVTTARSAIFFPPSARAARVLAPLDPLLTAHDVPGGAFVVVVAEKRASS